MNINRLLENSKRTSLIGKNLYTFEGYSNGHWSEPMCGLSAKPERGCSIYGVCIGHQIENLTYAVVPEFYENEKKLEFLSVRHRWTPAWQETYYRSTPDAEYYSKSGCISFRETKCITANDVFVSEIVISSDKRETTQLRVKLNSPIEGAYSFDIKIGALGQNISSTVFTCVKNTVSDCNEFLLQIPPNGQVSFRYVFGLSKKDMETAEKLIENALKTKNPFEENEKQFNAFIAENAPEFVTENFDILKIYYYRWFLVWRAHHKPSEIIENHPIPSDCFYESPYGSWYGAPVGLPVPLHVEETKWMKNSSWCKTNAENWIKGITNYREYIQYTPIALWHFYQNHQDKDFLERAYSACFDYSLGHFNLENEGLDFFKTLNSSWSTGAEYQPAFYQHTMVKWDWSQDAEGMAAGTATETLAIYRLDRIVYAIGCLIGCKEMAKELEKNRRRKVLFYTYRSFD